MLGRNRDGIQAVTLLREHQSVALISNRVPKLHPFKDNSALFVKIEMCYINITGSFFVCRSLAPTHVELTETDSVCVLSSHFP